MRIAILTLTRAGYELAEKISAGIGGQIFSKGRNFERMKNFVDEIFTKFDALIFICATGIAVRMIAPHILSKLSDPAVIVIDERGRNVISLIGGHVGGANDLTLKLAAQIDANPVITTATDVEEKLSADNFSARLGLMPANKDAIKAVNSAILRGEEVFVTAGNVRLNLTARNLICGIGCKRGTSIEKISRAVESACKMIHQPVERIKIFATIDIKRDEKSLLEFVKNLGRDIKFFNVAELNEKVLSYKLAESDFVKKNIGVGNVCEAAALSVSHGKFALPKTKFDEVTVALLWEDV